MLARGPSEGKMKKYEAGLVAIVVALTVLAFMLGILGDHSGAKRDVSPPAHPNIGVVDLSSPDGKATGHPSPSVPRAPHVTAHYRAVIGLWLGWTIGFLLASGWSAPTVKTTQPGERTLEKLFIGAGGGCLFLGAIPQLNVRLYSLGALPTWVLVALVACGFGLYFWARLHIGRMWSSAITLKKDHAIIDTGPYALVRHPMYTGILLAAWATAALDGGGLAGALLMSFGYYLKARREERLLTTELGAPYETYRHRVPMLLPRLTRARIQGAPV